MKTKKIDRSAEILRELRKRDEKGRQWRSACFDRASGDEDSKTVPLSFSSEEPVERWFGNEILAHEGGAIRTDRSDEGLPFLLNHDTDKLIGRAENIKFADRRGRADVRFSQSDKASEIRQDVADGIRPDVSFGYIVHKMVLHEENKDGPDTYRVTDWEPIEITSAPIPADVTVGWNRSAEDLEDPKPEETRSDADTEKESAAMAEEPKTPEVVDVKAAEARAAQSMNDRTNARAEEVLAYSKLCPEIKEIERFLDVNIPSHELALEARRAFESRNETPPAFGEPIGMEPKQIKRFSVLRALDSLANPNDNAKRDAATLEFEASREAVKLAGKPGGANMVTIPVDVSRRDLTVGSDPSAGYLVGTDHLGDQFIGMPRPMLLSERLGATIMGGLKGDVSIPKQTAGATASWVAEGAAGSEATQTVAQLNLRPKTVTTYTDISRLLTLQSSPDAEQFVRNDLSASIDTAIDVAAIAGPGTDGEPMGIIHTTGVGATGATGTNGGALTYAHMCDAEGDIVIANTATARTNIAINGRVRREARQIQEATGEANSRWLYEQMGADPTVGQMLGYPAYTTENVPHDLVQGTSSVCSAFIIGDWSQLVIAMWGGFDILVDPYTQSTAGTVRVVVFKSVDIGIRLPQAFSIIADVTTA